MLFNIYAGLGGGFGGARYMGTIDCENENAASDYAYELARDEYNLYEGMYGLFDPGDAYDNPEDYGLSDEPTEDEIEELVLEDMENWIDYKVIPANEDENIDECEREMLD